MENKQDRQVILISILGAVIVGIVMWIGIVYAGPKEDRRICISYQDKYPGRVFNQETVAWCNRFGINIE